ncbi:MAG: hypothetical protein EOP49_03485 [Sphingobacteriales bacterium]|nr:MAG: hypothetical protein EOP49_03485 [Sphingobacteriales bacterium]
MKIEPMGSSRSYRMMQGFIDQLTDSRLADRLATAIEGKKPFAAFTRIIDKADPGREQWFHFRDQRYQSWIEYQLEDELEEEGDDEEGSDDNE